MAHSDFDKVDFTAVKGVIASGTALVKEIGEEWEDRTSSKIYESYGLSETTTVLACNSPDACRFGTVGRAMMGSQIKLIYEHGGTNENGTSGETCVRGPQVMDGYWQRPEATDEAIDALGCFHAGDVGVLDEDGYVRIVDRLKDMVIVSGFNVYPNEVEAIV